MSLLGQGGMGEVWRAYDTGTDRLVALKVLPAYFTQDVTFEERFRREAHAACAAFHRTQLAELGRGRHRGNLYVTDMGGTDPGGQYRVFKLPVT